MTREEALAQYTKDKDLCWADLSGACLRGVDLSGADLRVADLSGADLGEADLHRADLGWANLAGADLSETDLRGADLRGAEFVRAKLEGAKLPDAPVVPGLDRAILAAVSQPGCGLVMEKWHTCETTHCLAGWAVHLAGAEGYALEKKLGSATAGTLIFHASTGSVPDFYATNEKALVDLKSRAEQS